ncbi:unannotated protein [freshwater metagenome]|uniref:FAD:protein FMN transferase n=1 Tax=freshwater metagenome TaxID=449393 RepID=A0A6J6FY79_9ZZZZ|nr:hypothetical protein [Actinomycetota bacterium]MSZ96008.1 hypothetical protein [Actinomycetota bacterium]
MNLLAPLTARLSRRCMGVHCVATITGPTATAIAKDCLDQIDHYEQLWSRFISSSDISRLNNAKGQPVWVDPLTVQLISYLIAAHEQTNGAFNPTLLPLQIHDGDFRSLVDKKVSSIASDSHPFTDLTAIAFLADGRVSLPEHMTLDAGGLAKGFTADLVVAHALSMGATSACINIGGDMAILTPVDAGWVTEITHPTNHERTVSSISVSHGGIATSTTNARLRGHRGITSHIFTSEGPLPCDKTVSATVVASSAAWADAWTKYAISTPVATALAILESKGFAGLLIDAQDNVFTTTNWSNFSHE